MSGPREPTGMPTPVGDGMQPVQPLDVPQVFADTGRLGAPGCTTVRQRQRQVRGGSCGLQ
jgi:hypothetical protein